MLEAVKQNGYALAYASVALKADREIVRGIKQKGFALEHASTALKDDLEIVLSRQQELAL